MDRAIPTYRVYRLYGNTSDMQGMIWGESDEYDFDVESIMHLSLYVPTYQSVGNRWGFDGHFNYEAFPRGGDFDYSIYYRSQAPPSVFEKS